MQFISTLWDRSRLTSHLHAQDLSHRTRSNEDHNRIMAAVRAHDAESAAGLIANHVRNATGGILDQNLVEQPV